MADLEFYSILTEKGKEKEMACLAGKQEFDIWEIAVGDSNGSYYEPDAAQTSLKKECWRGSVIRCENVDNTRYAVAEIPANKGGFTIREIGGYDKSGNLVIVGKFPENVKRLPETGDIKQLTLKLDLSVVNEIVLPLIVDPSINTPSVAYVEKHFQALREKGEPEGYASLDEYGRVPSEQLPLYVKGCVNSGPVDENGEPAILSYDETTRTITVNAPFVYTTYSGKTCECNQNLSAVIDENLSGTIRFWAGRNKSNGEFFVEPLANSIYIQNSEPQDVILNDVWFDTSVAPETSKRKTANGWEIYEAVEIGSLHANEDLTTDIRNNPYNKSLEPECANIELSNVQPSQNFKDMSVDWCMPDYASGVSFGSGFVAPSAGWIFGYTRANSGSDGSSLYVNGLMSGKSQGGNTIQDPVSLYALVAKGDIVTLVRMSGTFYPMKGVTNA